MAALDDDTLAAWRAFLNAHAQVTRRISRDLAAAGLPDLSWYDLLWALYRQRERGLRVNELAREVVLSPTAMSRFVDRVVAAGCVRREPDPRRPPRAADRARRRRRRRCSSACGPIYAAGIEAALRRVPGPLAGGRARDARADGGSAAPGPAAGS